MLRNSQYRGGTRIDGIGVHALHAAGFVRPLYALQTQQMRALRDGASIGGPVTPCNLMDSLINVEIKKRCGVFKLTAVTVETPTCL